SGVNATVSSPVTVPSPRMSTRSAYRGRRGSGSARGGTMHAAGEAGVAVVAVVDVLVEDLAVDVDEVLAVEVVVVDRATGCVLLQAAASAIDTNAVRARTVPSSQSVRCGRGHARADLCLAGHAGAGRRLDDRFGEPVDAYVNGSQV